MEIGMKYCYFIFTICLVILMPLPNIAFGLYSIPPTDALQNIKTSNGTVKAKHWNENFTFQGTKGITITGSDVLKTIFVNGPTSLTNQGSYNTTLANNTIINSGGYKINFLNGTGNPIHMLNSDGGNQVNVTISGSSSSFNCNSSNNCVNLNDTQTIWGKKTFNNGTNLGFTQFYEQGSGVLRITANSSSGQPYTWIQMLPNATQSGSKFELYGNDGQNYGLKLFASNDASGGFIDWLNRHDRPLTIQTSGICVGSSDCAKIILSGTSKSISFNGGELKSIGIPTASDSAQISNYLGLLGSLVTGICNDGQILQYQSSNSTWICSTSSNNNPAPKISINGNNRSSFTGIIANQTFPAPKIVINSFNSSSFIFGGGVGISISNSSSTHTIKNIGVISATGTSGNLTVNLNTGNVTFNTGNNLAYLAKFNNFTNNNKISTNSKLFIGDGLGNAAGPFLQSPTASPQTLLFGPTSSTSNMVLSGNGLRLGNNTGGSQINPSGANLFLVNPDSRSGILRMEGQGSAGVYQFYEYNGNFVTKMSTLNGDYLGASQGFGFASGTGFNTYRSAWDFRASQDWNTTAQGTYIDFWTTPFNTIVPSEKLRIKDSGDIGFLSGAKLFLDGVAGTGNSYLSRTGSTTTVLDNNGHISTFPATTGTLCQTNQTGSCGTSPSGDIVQAGNIGKGTGSFGPFSSITGSNKLNFKNATAGIGIAESGNTTDITFKNIGVISLTGISGNITTTGGAITGNLTVNTGNNLGYLAKNQLWTGTNTYNGILDLMNTGTFKIGSGKTLIRNPAGTFAYNFLSSAILANETLTLPLTRQTETLAVVPQTAQNTNTTVQTTASASLIFTGKPLSITPQVTGNVRVHFTGYASSGTLLDGCTIQMQEGTGTAPKAGNPSSGTTVGVSIIATSATANANTPFTIIYPITGLTKGTTVWFEPVFSNAIGGTCSMRNTMLVLTEY